VNAGAVLRGQGGIGKSTLAVHYAYTYRANYDAIIWLPASTRQEVINGLVNHLWEPAGLQIEQFPAAPQLVHAMWVLQRIAATGKRWLFIYDNVEKLEDIRDLGIEAAHQIVTTRFGAGWQGWEVIPTDTLPFDTEDAPAVELLQHAAGQVGEAAEARDLAQALGGLPLALVVAGALIRETGEGFATYAGRLAEVLAHVPANGDYPSSVLGAVKLSYDALSPDAQMIADLCAWWASEGLTPDLLTDAPQGAVWGATQGDVPEALQDLAADAARVRAGFVELTARSLLTREGDGWSMHRMTALALQLQPGARAEAATALLAAVYPSGIHSPMSSETWPICARLTPHLRAIWASGASPEGDVMDFLLNQAGGYLRIIDDLAGAAELSNAYFQRAEVRLTEADRDLPVALGNHAMTLRMLGDLPSARALLERAVTLNQAHRPGTQELAATYLQLGRVLVDQGKAGDGAALDLALRHVQRAVRLRRVISGRSEGMALALNNLAGVRDAQGRGAAAARLYGISLKIQRAVLPPRDARLGYGLLNAGSTLLQAGQADLAESPLRDALDLWEEHYAAQAQHSERRGAADWLIVCLLRRAAAGENRGEREEQARQLCDRYGYSFADRTRHAMQYPYTPDLAKRP
jgi:tetratricopeptide (TPR) repeat protein